MKAPLHSLLLLTLLSLPVVAVAQEVEFVDDADCGCELRYVDGIETTHDGDRYGFRLADGTVIADNIYEYTDAFHGDYCRVYLGDGLGGLIDRRGRVVVPCVYDELHYPTDGRVWVSKGGRVGFTDLEGNVVIALQYRNASSYSEGLACVLVDIDSTSVGCTFIDTLGRPVFPPIYQNLMPFHDGMALAVRYDRWGIIDRQGRELLPFMYESISEPADGVFFAGIPGEYAMFDTSMRRLTPFIYSYFSLPSEGMIAVGRGDLYGFVDLRGREVVPCRYELVGHFQMGRAWVVKDGHLGIIDTSGRFVLPPVYENTTQKGTKYTYFDSLALVEKGGKLGFVDLDGKPVTPLIFEEAYDFSQGLAAVRFGGLWGYIDTKGEVYIPPVFDLASPFEWGRAEVYYQGRMSKINLQGRCVRNCQNIISWR